MLTQKVSVSITNNHKNLNPRLNHNLWSCIQSSFNQINKTIIKNVITSLKIKILLLLHKNLIIPTEKLKIHFFHSIFNTSNCS